MKEPKNDISIDDAINKAPYLKSVVFRRGFIITSERIILKDGYPFYSNWTEKKLSENYYLYTHSDTTAYTLIMDNTMYFLIGHAYDPFQHIINETDILHVLAEKRMDGDTSFWDAESNLTGVFCLGYIRNGRVVYSTDATGMQVVYHGVIDGKFFITSHSKLIGDIKGIKRTKYIDRLVSSRYWHYWGMYLPGDISPYDELKRLVPNFYGEYGIDKKEISCHRYFPVSKIEEIDSEEEYLNTIHELGRIMSDTMKCISQKWVGKKVSISVTGGRDSMTTLACSRDVYDKFHYFSYISNYDESVDAEAAARILKHLGLQHEVFQIPDGSWGGYTDLDSFKAVMKCNSACIGDNNENDLRKRRFFLDNPPCDIEVKSWVNEAGRGWEYNKYNKKRFPQYPTASYWRAMHKVYVSPYLIHHTDRIFKEYLKKYYSKDVFDKLSWLELFFWEFTCSSSEAYFLTTEHRISYEITIPFNNRKYLAKMMTVPVEKRKNDCIPKDLISYMEPRITETGVLVKDVSHTSFRAFIVRMYLEVFSRIRF